MQDIENLIVPAICICEVFKTVLRQRGEDAALQTIALLKRGTEIDLTSGLALEAVKISLDYKMPMAGSIILTTARACEAIVWTQDQDFKDLEGVQYFPKKRQPV